MQEGNLIHNVKCGECGTNIPTAELQQFGRILCSRCAKPRPPEYSAGRTGYYHAEDDLSGPSASWDMIVRLNEGD